MHCRRAPSWSQCQSGPLLYDDNVYTWSKVATSMPWGPYASCNPLPSDPSGKTWSCGSHGHASTLKLSLSASYLHYPHHKPELNF